MKNKDGTERKPKGGARTGAGRKHIYIDWDKIDELLNIACTGEEIASVLGINYDTINTACKREKEIEFSDYIKSGINKDFKKSLRRTQRMVAFGYKDGDKVYPPDKIMLIWLGKQYLNQTDKNELAGKDGKDLVPIQIPQIIIIESNEKKENKPEK